MSTAEDQALKDKIEKLKSLISRHREAEKNGAPHGNGNGNRGLRSAPYPQGYRGRGRPVPMHRNKTLVLNGASSAASVVTPSDPENQSPDPTTASWVTKTDRHLQLINRNVYERETQQRAQAIEQTYKQKHINRDHREKAHFIRNMQQAGRDPFTVTSGSANPGSRYEVEVDGVRYYVTQQGSKLVKAPDDLNPPNATPKVTTVHGVKFHRTKNGNLVRHGIVQAQRRAGGVTKVDENCKAFSWTGTCPKGPTCRYIHDVSKTAICKTWLLKGDCPRRDDCDLSHDITEERTPLCMHFANGNCNNPSCSYIHAQHSPTDPVCRTFGIYGYCGEGARCAGRHVFECPDFSNKGVCNLKGCKRPHIERASMLRKASKRASSQDMDDVSSEDEDVADSDDVDSDEVEEFIGHDEVDLSFAEQKDFIGFS